MKLYKLTDDKDCTYGGCQWGEGVTVETTGQGGLCGPGWTHWYTDPLLAVFLNPVCGNYYLGNAHLWEGEGEPTVSSYGIKVGCSKATTLRRIDMPAVSDEQRVRFAILCAMEVTNDETWRSWAKGWLSGRDRSAPATWPFGREESRHFGTPACWAAQAGRFLARENPAAVRYHAAEAVAWAASAFDPNKGPLDLVALAHQAVTETSAGAGAADGVPA